MAMTIIGVNDPKAVKKYSAALAVDVAKTSYWAKRFTGGKGSSMPVHRLTELENDAGEYISYDLNMQLKMEPIEGDNILEGKEEELKFYTDGVYIDQARGGVNSGGRMTRKRTIHDLRKVAKSRQRDWWARAFDELMFMYLSGTRGTNTDFIFPTTYTGRANNAFSAPDSEHHLWPRLSDGSLAATGTMTVAETMVLDLIDRAVAHAQTMGGGTQEVPRILPVMVEGEKRYVCIMSPWQVYDLRAASESMWLAFQRDLTTAVGRKSGIFTGALGLYNNVVLHQHENVIRTLHGADGDVACARALFLGEQAGVIAFGSPGTGLRYGWHEETRDNGNILVITTNSIFGMKKCTFNGLDYGVIAIETAAKNPNS